MALSKFAVLSAGAFLTFAVGAPAIAQELTVRVDYSDLDLASTTGQHVLQQRLKSAVRKVCGPDNARVFANSQQAALCHIQAAKLAKQDAEIAIARYDNGPKMASRREAMVGN